MNLFLHSLEGAWQTLTSGSSGIWVIVRITLQVVAVSTVAALALGLPAGIALGVGRFRGRRALLVLANSGLSLPPVVVGLILLLLMYPGSVLGSLRLAYTVQGLYVAQTVLALPVVAALTASAVGDLPRGLLDQARAFGAGRAARSILAAREARLGILAATIAAAGASLSEVGAIVIVGGNGVGKTQTLASATLALVGAGDYTNALAVGILLLTLIVLLTAALTWLQYGKGQISGGRV